MYFYKKTDKNGNIISYISLIRPIGDDDCIEITESEYSQSISGLRANLPESEPVEYLGNIIDELIGDDDPDDVPADEIINALIGED